MDPANNPFATPRAGLGPESFPAEGHYGDATKEQRFGNFIVDTIVAMLCAQVFIFALESASSSGGISEALARVARYFAMISYYFLLEAITGRTLGKLLTGTKVIDADTGGPTTWLRIVGRSFARFVPFESLSFIGGDARGWHDTWSHTRVVRLRPNRPRDEV